MYSRRKGKARSLRPSKRSQPSWLRYKKKEAELLIVKLAKEGTTASKIGLILRDTYGVPDVKQIVGKGISHILADHKIVREIPEDLNALIRKAGLIKKHLVQNRKDMPGLRGLQLTEAKINRLAKYYKRVGKLPETWKYDPDKIALVVE